MRFLLLPLVALVATHADLVRVQHQHQQTENQKDGKSPTALAITGVIIGSLGLGVNLAGMANARYQRRRYREGMEAAIKDVFNPIPSTIQDADLDPLMQANQESKGEDRALANHAEVLSEVLKRTNLAICE